MSKAVAIAVLLGLLVVGIAFGVARDLYSREARVLEGEIVTIKPPTKDFKSAIVSSPRLKVRLDDGVTVDVSTASVTGLSTGQRIAVSEMVMPWGQIWYVVKATETQ